MQRARFAFALVLVLAVGCGGGGGGGGDGGGAASPADFVCDKAVSCELFPGQYRDECMQQAKVLEMYVVDPAAVVDCLKPVATCEAISEVMTGDPNNPPAWLTTCLAYDTSSFQCSADQSTLHVCNTSQKCKELNCQQACRDAASLNARGCGIAGGATYPRCICAG